MNPFGSQLLNVITYLPLVGAVQLLVLFRKEQKELVAKVATGIAGLDFLGQELLREANTMGSKSPDATLSHEVVALKGDIEKIKEQILNVE